jgi:hypothetical protein
MTGMQVGSQSAIFTTAGLEAQLAKVLSETSSDVARIESLDQEQRAEVYAILQAIEADSLIHRQMVAELELAVNPAKKAIKVPTDA